MHLGQPKFSGPPASLTILFRMVKTTSAVTVSAGYLENPEYRDPFEVGRFQSVSRLSDGFTTQMKIACRFSSLPT